jgi:hypothetical protein
VSRGEDDVVRVELDPGADVDAHHIREFLQARMAVAPDPVAVLIDQRRIQSMTREAQLEGTRGSEHRPTLCLAILVEGPITVMIANFFIILGRPRYPTRLFTSETAALEWIEVMRRSAARDE